MYIGPGKKSDEDECDGCAEDGGGWASPITKAETKVKNKLRRKKIIRKLATKQFSCTIHIILDTDRHKTTSNSAKCKEPWRLVTTPEI